MTGPTVISTFSGCGGSSLGYKAAGCKVLAAVEWDAHAVKCYRLNHPSTRVFHGDIAKVSVSTLLSAAGLAVGELDILDGSPPCQGFSTAGLRILDDPRNALFREQLRLIDGLEPKCIVIENVGGMLKGKMRRVAAEIYKALTTRGYKVVAGLMYASRFGVGQKRPRVFFLGSRVGTPRLPRPTSHPTTAKAALRGIEPDDISPLSAKGRWFLHHIRPGEKGDACLKRLGKRPSNWSTHMLHPKKPAPTITSVYPFHGTYHWKRRPLSIREAMVLTGFPADYQLVGTFSARWARIGNSVAPPMTREIARQVFIPILTRAK